MSFRRALAIATIASVSAVLCLAGVWLLPPTALGRIQALALLSGAGFAAAVIVLVRAIRAAARRIDELTAVASALASGEEHRFAAIGGEDGIAALAMAINEVADGVRRQRAREDSDHVIDQGMVRETPNGLLVIDAKGCVSRANPAVAALVPVRGEIIGRRPIEAIPVAELQEVLDETARTRGTAERSATVGARDLLFRAKPLPDGTSCMGVILDITSVRAAERSRRDFVANVSHELRTPITALIGYTEGLIEEQDRFPADAIPMLRAIERNAHRLNLLVEDVLQLSKIESRSGPLPLEDAPLGEIVEGVVERYQKAAAGRQVSVSVEIPEEVRAAVNPEAFDHALGNLVDNAIKYNRMGGVVRVSARTVGERVAVDVADEGAGMEAVHHPRIFERFYRGDPARSREIPGTGLGLALVKHLCLAMAAEIAFVSAPGEGSTFTLLLPASRGSTRSGP